MRYAIIEDEPFAREHLFRLMSQIWPEAECVFQAESAEECIDNIDTIRQLDLMFLDIELSDGNCFDIFSHTKFLTPVIFTTAYDQFALESFKMNSIGYLLKPVTRKDMEGVIQKFRATRPVPNPASTNAPTKNQPRSRILLRIGDGYFYKKMDEIAMFVSEDKNVIAVMNSGKRYITEFVSLQKVEEVVDTSRFYRASRSMIVAIDSIHSVRKHFNGRLRVTGVAGTQTYEVIIQATKRADFLDWFGGLL